LGTKLPTIIIIVTFTNVSEISKQMQSQQIRNTAGNRLCLATFEIRFRGV